MIHQNIYKSIIEQLLSIIQLLTTVIVSTIIQIKNYMKKHCIDNGLIINFAQCGKNTTGTIGVKYVTPSKIYTFDNGVFTESLTITV